MIIQIIESQEQSFLRDYFGCELYKQYEVAKQVPIKHHAHKRLPHVKRFLTYIRVHINYKSNDYGKETLICLKDNEFRVLKT
jgi:hypothetical protein